MDKLLTELAKVEVEEFVKEGQTDLQAFLAYWEKNHKENPERFPAAMSFGDWAEQYEAFVHWTHIRERL